MKIFLRNLWIIGKDFYVLCQERRNDVAEAFDDDRYVQTGFWLKVPEYIFRDDIKKCRVICKNNNIFGSKQIEMQQKSDV